MYCIISLNEFRLDFHVILFLFIFIYFSFSFLYSFIDICTNFAIKCVYFGKLEDIALQSNSVWVWSMIFTIYYFCPKFQIDNSQSNTALDPVFNEFERIKRYGMLREIVAY